MTNLLKESDAQLLGRIDANVQILLLSYQKLEQKIEDVQRTKADLVIVDKIDSKLEKHLGSIDEIVAAATLPYADTLKDHSRRIDKIERRLIRWGSYMISIGIAMQIIWFFIQDKIKEML